MKVMYVMDVLQNSSWRLQTQVFYFRICKELRMQITGLSGIRKCTGWKDWVNCETEENSGRTSVAFVRLKSSLEEHPRNFVRLKRASEEHLEFL
jgi:hypothetical protein